MKLLTLLLLSLCSVLGLRETAAAEKPNILVIVADDLGYADIGVHGGKAVPTPNIDALAASGVRCTNGYVSCPYCSPTRAGFFDGTLSNEVRPRVQSPCGRRSKTRLAARSADDRRSSARCRLCHGGDRKWHQGFSDKHHPQSRGFDEFFGFLVGGHNYLLHKDAKPIFGSAHSHDLIYRGREVQHLDGYTTDLFTDEAIRNIDRHSEKPWFLYLAYNAVHTPLEIADKFKDRIPADVIDPARRGYLSLLLGLDDAVGRLMQHLNKTGKTKRRSFFSSAITAGRDQALFCLQHGNQ